VAITLGAVFAAQTHQAPRRCMSLAVTVSPACSRYITNK